MDLRKARENLGRIKIYYLKGESLRALQAAIGALKDLVQCNPLPSEMRGLLREGLQLISRDDNIKPFLKGPFIYQPGQERNLLVTLVAAYKSMDDAVSQESHATSLERKRRLDQAINLGQKFLAQGKVSEAEEAFQAALRNYRDEHRVFLLVGRWLLEAQQPRRAVPYLRKATELEPTNTAAFELLSAAMTARHEAAR